MPKITNNILIATSSTTPTINSNYAIFVSSSNLYLTSASFVQQLNLDTGYFRILEYTGSATSNENSVYTYEISPLVKMITIVAAGAGGGGGGGARKDTNTGNPPRSGGAGGAGAGLIIMTLMSQSLQPSYIITVPGAPTGGLGAVVAGNGSNGQTGGNTTVGSIILAPGGPGGGRGSTQALPTEAASLNAIPKYGPYFLIGAAGGRSSDGVTTPTNAGNVEPSSGKYITDPYWRSAMSGIKGMAGGGAGAIITVTDTTLGPTSGSGVNIYGNVTPPGNPGTNGTAQSAQPSPSNVLNAIHLFGFSGSLLQCRYGVGAGGSGGASSITPGTPGGNGGDGGFFGAAGGGGGAGTGSRGGNGGSGSAGYVAILEFY